MVIGNAVVYVPLEEDIKRQTLAFASSTDKKQFWGSVSRDDCVNTLALQQRDSLDLTVRIPSAQIGKYLNKLTNKFNNK